MRHRTLSLLIALLLIISPLAQALGQCVLMNADNAEQMSKLELDLCQDIETYAVCVAEAPANNTLIDDEGCYSGNLCTPHFYAINTDAGIAKQFFYIPSFLVTPTRVAILSQIIPPEIKPPIGIA